MSIELELQQSFVRCTCVVHGKFKYEIFYLQNIDFPVPGSKRGSSHLNTHVNQIDLFSVA